MKDDLEAYEACQDKCQSKSAAPVHDELTMLSIVMPE